MKIQDIDSDLTANIREFTSVEPGNDVEIIP